MFLASQPDFFAHALSVPFFVFACALLASKELGFPFRVLSKSLRCLTPFFINFFGPSIAGAARETKQHFASVVLVFPEFFNLRGMQSSGLFGNFFGVCSAMPIFVAVAADVDNPVCIRSAFAARLKVVPMKRFAVDAAIRAVSIHSVDFSKNLGF
jgi:hypothetical protein